MQKKVREISQNEAVQSADEAYLARAISLLKERVSKVDELEKMGSFFFEDPEEYDPKPLKKWKEDSTALVSEYQKEIESMDDDGFEAGTLKQKLEGVIERNEVGFGKLMMPLRIAVTGQGFGPDLFISMEMLGKETVMRRIDRALSSLAQE